jgi:hypothetical protein
MHVVNRPERLALAASRVGPGVEYSGFRIGRDACVSAKTN